MPAYHSSYNDETEFYQVGNMSILPINTRIRGNAPTPADPTRPDIVDEALTLFRANSLFRNFEIKGGADRVLIYLILFIGDLLSKVATPKGQTWNAQEATKQLTSYALEAFTLPGEPGFPLNNLYAAVRDRNEAESLRQYLTQARQETVVRFVEHVYDERSGGKASKWWMSFQKRKFMGKSLAV